MNEFDDFLNSLEARKYKPIMTHNPSEIGLAKAFYKDYLTEDELCERQYIGRFWSIENQGYLLYIIVDNETVITVSEPSGAFSIVHRNSIDLPDKLRGYYYD